MQAIVISTCAYHICRGRAYLPGVSKHFVHAISTKPPFGIETGAAGARHPGVSDRHSRTVRQKPGVHAMQR